MTLSYSWKTERKSRFEVSSSNLNENQLPSVKLDTYPLTREPSFRHQRTLSRESFGSSRIGRFSIEKEDTSLLPTDSVHPFDSSIHSPNDYRKKGRFELSSNSNTMNESPQATVSSSSQASSSIATPSLTESQNNKRAYYLDQSAISSSLYNQVEFLLQQNELQKNVLHDAMYELASTGLQQHSYNTQTSTSARRRSSAAEPSKASCHSSDAIHPISTASDVPR